ncbi:MAG: hypothetical protein LBT29_00425, partial [Flavobacteriaceae bacterium]|nr:hypothetical protein [Flavobacteriaceae bacterium]
MSKIINLNAFKEKGMFELIPKSKKFALNNSYFKNHRRDIDPANPFEVYEYYKQHGELPYKDNPETNEYWLYDCFVEYQKRAGVKNSQYFTPPKTAERIAELANTYFSVLLYVTDACCGFGMLTKALRNKYKFIVYGFDNDADMCKLYIEHAGVICTKNDFTEELDFCDYNIIANPPYETPSLTDFLKWLYCVIYGNGIAILLIPQGFMDKKSPKATAEAINKFTIIHREPMQEPFARTNTRAEIVVLRK